MVTRTRQQAANRKELLRGLQMETLEQRQLLTGSPELAGVTTNDNTLLVDGEVLRQSPRELTFRFNRDASLDPTTYGGIQVVRSGNDGAFASASAVTDFGSNSAVTVEFTAVPDGIDGNGITIELTTADLGPPATPQVTVEEQTISVVLNTNSVNPTTASKLVDAMNEDVAVQELVTGRIMAELNSDPDYNVAALVATTPVQVVLGGSNDIVLAPGYVSKGDFPREILFRFKESLPDDSYQVNIYGDGPNALMDVDGSAFNEGENLAIDFAIDLPPQVQSVVPQPIMRDVNGQWTQASDQVHVYFNDDDLSVSTAESRDFYQLIYTRDTLENTDDVVFLPKATDGVKYYADADMAIVTFETDLQSLVDPGTGQPLEHGTFRFRVGTDESIPLVPIQVDLRDQPGTVDLDENLDAGDSFGTALPMGVSLVVESGGEVVGEGDSFRLTDSSGEARIFEFDPGYILQLPSNGVAGNGGAWDGQRFQVNDVTFEFNFADDLQNFIDENADSQPDHAIIEVGQAHGVASLVREADVLLGRDADIMLTSSASSVDDFYVGNKIEITTNSGSGIVREIVDYDGVSKIATVDAAWDVSLPSDPLSRWRYRIHENQSQLTEIVRAAIDAADVGVTPVVLADGEIHLGPVAFEKQETVSPATSTGQVTAVALNTVGLLATALPSQVNHVGFEIDLVTDEASGLVSSMVTPIDFTKIQLEDHSPSVGALLGMQIELTSGSGAGQVRTISGYDQISFIATVSEEWLTPPDVSTGYTLTRTQTRLIQSYDEVTTTVTVDSNWSNMLDGSLPNNASQYVIHAAGNMTETGTSEVPLGESNSVNTMYLAAAANPADQAYAGLTIEITGGTGLGETNVVYGYDGSNRLATVMAPWGVTPDATSTYEVQLGRARLPLQSADSNSAYWGLQLEITEGAGAGQVRTISHYDGASKVVTVSEGWVTQPDETSQFQIATTELSASGQPGTQIDGAIPISFVPSAALTPPEILSKKIADAIDGADFGVRAGVGENTAAGHVGLVGIASFDTGPIATVNADTVADFMNMDQLEVTDQSGNAAIFRLRDFESSVPETPVNGVPVYPVVFHPDMTVQEVMVDLVKVINSTFDFNATARVGSLGIEFSQDSTNPSEVVTFVSSPDSPAEREMPLTIELTAGVSGLALQQLDSFIVRSSIDAQPLPLKTLGAMDAPGHREIRSQRHYLPGFSADTDDGVATKYYNFQQVYALDSQDRPLHNIITDQQKERAREAFELVGHYAGIQFVETDSTGITVATGDLQAVDPGEGKEVDRSLMGLGGLTRAEDGEGNPIVVMDGEDFSASGSDLYGGSWFKTAIQAIQQVLGISYTDELAPETLSGDWDSNPTDANPFLPGHQALMASDPMFPGHQDQVHLQHLYRKDSIDIDVYQLMISSAGLFTVETIAERRLEASHLDTMLRLYRELTDTNGNVIGRELVAQNDDYFSDDSFLELELQPGIYYLGVSASGNDRYDPSIARTGFGGTTQGVYDLRVTRRPDVDQSIEDDQTGLSLDGDLDGEAGGVYNSWFRTAPTIAANEARVPGEPRVLFVDKAASGTSDGTIDNPYTNINDAFANSAPGDVVRILGNRAENSSGTEDDTLKALEDVQAYEVGFSRLLGTPLADGAKMQVPQGVTVMVDEGAVFQLRRAEIGIGSTDSVVDRSGASLQVLGTPRLLKWNDQWEPVEVHRDLAGNPVVGNVYFTSLHDAEIGQGTNPDMNPPAAEAGDWGGLAYRHRLDASQEDRLVYEAEGIFLNAVAFADIRYGGGIVEVDSIPQVVRPIDMTDARPTVHFNQISHSADAAIGSTPNSSEETNFHAPNYQAIPFTSDYSRTGPDIVGNLLVDNSINGHFLVIATPATQGLEKLTVTAKWDDEDAVMVIPENLVIQGSPGGLLMVSEVPPVNLVMLSSLEPGEGSGQGTLRHRANEPYYQYRIVFVDSQGQEGNPSEATSSVQVSLANDGQGRIQLDNLPTATGNYVSRRLYRSTTDGSYERVADLNANDETYVDDGTTRGGDLVEYPLNFSARLDASLVVGEGVVVKLDGAYIDVGLGAQLYAEASGINPSVFTSIRDARYGRGGTFDTAMQGTSQLAAGDWGGIHARATSSLSLDHVVVAYAGGVTRVEGNFTGFNPIEIHQAQARIANSRFEHNLDGQGGQAPASRYGRLTNEEAVIFVRGSEAVIVDNLMLENQAPVISVDINSMNSAYQDDYGRSIGQNQRNSDYDGNQGVLVRGNRLERNDVNGLMVREGVLNTAGVMDETDMTLVVDGPIYVTDMHTAGGLRLESKVTESLVVKFDGPDAGFVVTGMPLDIVDRIGGVIEVLGQPQAPVVLTALGDDQVGNGLKLDGTTQKDTDNEQLGFQFENLVTTENDPLPDALVPWLIDNDVVLTPMTAGQFQFHTGPGGESGTALDWTDPATGTALGPFDQGLATAQGRTAMLQQNFINEFLHFVSVSGDAVNLSSTNVTVPPQKVAFDEVVSEGTFQGNSGATVNWRVQTHMNDGEPIVWNTITFESDVALGDLQLISYLDQEFGGVVTDPDKSHFGGMLEIDYQVLQTPVEVGTISGEIQVAGTIVQTFTQQANGTIVVSASSGSGAQVDAMTLNPTTGVLTATWSAIPGVHTLANVTYQPLAQDILKTIGTPGQSDFRVMTLDSDQRVGIQQGGVYQDGSSGLSNGQFVGFAADKHSDLRDRITGSDPSLPPVRFSFSESMAVDSTDLPQFFDSDLGGVYGPEDITTAMAWNIDPTAKTATVTTFLELLPVYPVADLAGAWDGIQLIQHSYDRNVASVLEVESLASAYGDDSNGNAESSQQIGSLATDELSGDENRRLGFTVFADLSSSADVDVMSFTANGNTEVWFDIDGTSPSLDTVIELVDAQGNLLARSNDSGREALNPQLLDPLAIDAGPVILLTAENGTELVAADANPSLPAGDRIVLTDDQDVTTIFEFTLDGATSNVNHVAITYRESMDHTQLVRKVVETINATASTAVIARQENGRIHLENDHRGLGYRPRIFAAASRDTEVPAPLEVVRDHSSFSRESMVGRVNPLAKADFAIGNPLEKEDFAIDDHGTSNVLDAGMRVVLPGEATATNEYFVQVRSSSDDLWNLEAGKTQGEYQLQVRLRELDEQAGSTIRHADIRNATNGINVVGLPLHSHLVGEIGETNAANEDLLTAQDIGNLLASDVGTLSIAGALDSATDVDIYHFEVRHEHVTVQDETVPVAIDVDWSSGLSRPSTSAILYDATGNVVVIAEGSNIADDRPRPLEGLDLADHSRGSVGYDDPFIGPTELTVGDYYLAITHQDRAPESIYQQENQAVAIDPLIRLQPNPIYARIVEDHIETVGGGTLDQPHFSITIDANSFTPYHLGDVVTFVNSEAALKTINPFTGEWVTQADPPLHLFEAASKIPTDDLEVHPLSGQIQSFESAGVPQVVDTTGEENVLGAGTYLTFNGDGTAQPATNRADLPFVNAVTGPTVPGDPAINAPPVLGILYGNARQIVPSGQPAVPDPAWAGLTVSAMTFTNHDPRTADGILNDDALDDDFSNENLNVYGLAVASRPGVAEVTVPWYGDPNEQDEPGDQARKLELGRGLGAGTAVVVSKPIQVAGEWTRPDANEDAVWVANGLNEIQQLSVNPRPTSGVFRIGFQGLYNPDDPVPAIRWTGDLPWNATATDVQTALEGLVGIDPGDVVVTGGPFPNIPLEVEFTQTFAGQDTWRFAAMTSSAGVAGFAGLGGVDDAWMANMLYTFNPETGRAFPTNTYGTTENDNNCQQAGIGLGAPADAVAPMSEFLVLNCYFEQDWGPEQTLGRARGQLDTFADPTGKHQRLLIAPEVTDVNNSQNPVGIIGAPVDADSWPASQFKVSRAAVETDGAVWVPIQEGDPGFEQYTVQFNLGPDLQVRHDLANGDFVLDGDTFELGDSVTPDVIEFDTGRRIEIVESNLPLREGDTLTVQDDNGVAITFTFTTDPDPAITHPIRLPLNDSGQVVEALVLAINEADFAVDAAYDADREFVALRRDVAVDYTAITDPAPASPLNIAGEYGLSATGVANGHVLIQVEEADNAQQFASNLAAGLNQHFAAIGDDDYQVSADGTRVNFLGYSSIDTSIEEKAWVKEVYSSRSNTGLIVVDVLAADSAADVARKIVSQLEDDTTLVARTLSGGIVEVGENSEKPTFANNAQQPSDPAVPAPGHPDYIIPYVFGADLVARDADDNWEGDHTNEFRIGGAGPGGLITGIASIKDQVYAVSDAGGFYQVNVDLKSDWRDDYLTYLPQSAPSLLGKDLQGLTAGPADTELFYLPIEDASSQTPIVITSTRHSLQEGDRITIEGVEGNINANGDFVVGKVPGANQVTADQFALYELDGETPVEYNGVFAPSSQAFIYELGKTEGRYENMLFAVDSDANVYALNTRGEIQDVFVDAQSTVSTELPNVTAISFSDLGSNLWHFEKEMVEEPEVAGDPMSDAGHRYTSYEAHQGEDDIAFDQPAAGFENRYIAFSDVRYDLISETVVGDQYDFAGGAHGSVETNAFSLVGYSPADQPYFYFDYQVGAGDEDAFRVFVGDESGSWRLLASNQADDIADDVQQLFNNTTTWRQSRVSLAAYSGQENIRLRFDFNTAADTDTGQEMTTGSALRLVSPADIPDEEVFVLDGVVTLDPDGNLVDVDLDSNGEGTIFEFDHGLTLLAPAGTSLYDENGVFDEPFNIDYANGAWAVQFVDESDAGTVSICTDPIQIVVNNMLSPRQVAQRMEGALTSYLGCNEASVGDYHDETYQLTDDDASENNDAIAIAFNAAQPLTDNPIIKGDVEFRFVSWMIGNNADSDVDPAPTPTMDVDLVKVPMNSGSTIDIAIDASAGGLDSHLRIFDAAGSELVLDYPDSEDDSLANFTASRTGDYFVGVSAAANHSYDPNQKFSGISGSEGPYNLTITRHDSTPRFVRRGAEINIPTANSLSYDPADEAMLGNLTKSVGGLGDAKSGNVLVPIHLGMTDREVAQAVQYAMSGVLSDANQDLVKTHNDTINIIGHEVTYYPPSLGLTVTMPGDPEGNDLGVGYRSVDRAMNNAHDGVRLDNLVIGFSETGNIVETDTGAAGTMTPLFQGQAELPDVLTGEYQVEIRYVQQDKLEFSHSLDTNKRFTQSKTLEASAGSDSFDGQTFAIGDGNTEVTFEFENKLLGNGVQSGNQEIKYQSDYTAPEVALAIWTAINEPAVQGILNVQAGPANGGLLAEASDSMVNLYGNAVIEVTVSDMTINADKTANDLRDELLGEGVVKTNDDASLNGKPVAVLSAGTFMANRNIMGMPAGVVLSTGHVSDIGRQNGLENTSGLASLKGDADLDVAFGLSSVANTTDSTSLEFKIRPAKGEPVGDHLYISYVYASEEHGDPAQDHPKDVMAIFVDGVNVATVPGTVEAIRSDTITGGYPLQGPWDAADTDHYPPLNAGYFINNDVAEANPSSTSDFAFDGYTTVMTLKVPVAWNTDDAGESTGNTIKLAVADVKTTDVDSALFILKGGISTTPPVIGQLLGNMLGTGGDDDEILMGHSNTERHQGQLVIEANSITNSSGYGIVVDAAPVDGAGRAYPGAPRHMREVNNEGLVPGVAVINNILSFNETGGIHFSGDVNAAGMVGPAVPFGRIVNNTVVGDLDTGVGIQVSDFASPTLLNNIVTNSQVGLEIDDTSNTTVVGGMLYGPNVTNFSNTTVGAGQSPVYLTASDPLFVAPESGNFYLAEGSKAIDRSLASLQDRSSLVAVKTPLGISASPILAPAIDAYGQLRVDDPSTNNSSGVGESAFVDVGALDRVDHYSPWAILVDPVDWTGIPDVNHLDQDETTTVVDLVHVAQEQFVIQLQDGRVAPDPVDGTGIEDSSVNSGSFAVFKDGERLTINDDYLFSYNDNSNTIYLTSLAGVWELDATYRIELSNVQGFEIRPSDGSNYADGDQFIIEDFSGNQAVFEFESGYNLQVRESLTLLIPTGGGLEITDGETFQVNDGTQLLTFEMDRNGVWQAGNQAVAFQVSDAVDEIAGHVVTALVDSGMDIDPVNLGEGQVHIGSGIAHQLIVAADSDFEMRGDPGSVEDGEWLTVDDGSKHVTFEFNRDQEVLDSSGLPGVHELVPFDLSMTHEELADILVGEIIAAGLGLTPVHLGEGRIHVGGALNHQVDTSNSQLSLTGQPGATSAWGIRVPSQGGLVQDLIQDGQLFSITDGVSAPVIFEFDSDQDALATNRTVPFTPGSTPDQVAWSIAAEIRASSLGATLEPTLAGNGIVVLGGTNSHELDVMDSAVNQVGVPGKESTNPVTLIEDETYTITDVAAAIATSINGATELENVFAVGRFDTVSVEGVAAVSGVEFLDSPAITDRAGNVLQPNQLDGDTSFVIHLSAGRDYSDAPDAYGTIKTNSGAGHVIVDGFHLGSEVDSETNGQPSVLADGDGADDDGAVFSTLRAGYESNVMVTVEGVRDGYTGELDIWVDWDNDAGWEETDRIAEGFEVKVHPGQDVNDLGQSWCDEDQNELGRWTCNVAFDVPGSSVPSSEFTSYARVRLSSSGVSSPLGIAEDGEVEDYLVTVESNPWQNGNDIYDVNSDSHVTPLDALYVITYLNANVGNSELPLDFTAGNGPDIHGRVDVTGDGNATPLDALRVINELNDRVSGNAEGEAGEGEADSARFAALGSPVYLAQSMASDQVQLETANQPEPATESAEAIGQDDDHRRLGSPVTHRDAQAITSPWWLDNSRLEDLDGILQDIGSEVDDLQVSGPSRDDVFANWQD